MQGVLKVMKLFKLTIMLSVLMSIVEVKAQVNSPISSKTEEPVLDYNDMNGDGNINASDSLLSYVSWLLGIGIDNIEMSNNPKIMPILSDFFSGSTMEVNGSGEYKENLKSCISIIDDDVIDNQIPSSSGRSTVQYNNRGGYFSVLLPMMLSLGNKYGKNLCPGLACEGHRVGLTVPYSPDDSYTALNNNGLAVKWLHNVMGWNVFNHSMTAQLPMNTYFVDGINSELADTILAEGTYVGPLLFRNTIVLDRLTGKWYEVNSTKTAWVERTPTKKYAMPFYQDYNTREWYFNRDFDFDYSWGEWFKRADELGLPYEKVIVHNGGTSSVYMCAAGRKYAYWSVRTSDAYNYPPIAATVNRTSSAPGTSTGAMGYNVYHPKWVKDRKSIIDYCINNKKWVVFMSHFNDQEYHRNYYLDGKEYPDKDPDYPEEWIIPIKNAEILDIIGSNEHDYINHPPVRLGINSWSEWHPAPGTQLAAFYEVLDYALSKGVEFVSPMEGWNTHGNILNLGVEKRNQNFSYDGAANQTPYTDEEKSYLTIGADMSIRCSYSPVSFTELSSPEITINVATAPIIYNGFAQTPDITVKDGEIILVNGIHYTVSYSNNINVGTAIVTITGKGHYIGTKTVTFTIDVPPIISFVDTKVKAVCVANWDTDHDGELSGAEAIAVTNLGEIFTGNTNVTSFNELQCFTGINKVRSLVVVVCPQ